MAHGKSLELAEIGKDKRAFYCTCEKPWAEHLKKDGSGPLKRFVDNPKHKPDFDRWFGDTQPDKQFKPKFTKAERRAHKRRLR